MRLRLWVYGSGFRVEGVRASKINYCTEVCRHGGVAFDLGFSGSAAPGDSDWVLVKGFYFSYHTKNHTIYYRSPLW